MPLTAYEIKRLAEQLQTLVPQLLELSEVDVNGARENLLRLTKDSNDLVAKFKTLAVDQVHADLHGEIAAARDKLKADRAAFEEEREAARQRASDIISKATQQGEAILDEYRARHEAVVKAMQGATSA